MRQTYHVEQIQAHEEEDDDPQREEHLAVEDAPAVGKVGNRKELERESQLAEAEHHFHSVEPSARLRHRLEHRWEEGKEGERKRQCQGKAEHTDGRVEHRA